MGLVSMGAPKEKVDFLRKLMNLNVFVEGGTYKGGTAKQMSHYFSKVYTIEKSEDMFNEAKSSLENISNVIMLKGDTRDHLKNIIEKENNLLFWLDSHWSGGKTYGENDECPLIEELDIIFSFLKKNSIILIDDARLFLAPPPKPHKIENWPSLIDILKVIPEGWELLELDDVIYILPKCYEMEFKIYLQNIITNIAKAKNKNRLLGKIFRKIGLYL